MTRLMTFYDSIKFSAFNCWFHNLEEKDWEMIANYDQGNEYTVFDFFREYF